MDDPAPLHITLQQGSVAAVNRRFIGGFFAFAILFAGAAFYRPAIQAFAVGFPIYLVWWKLRLRTASRPGDLLVVSPDRLTYRSGERSRRVDRVEGEAVRFRRSRSNTELLVLNPAKVPVFKVELGDSDEDSVVRALSTAGWPVLQER